MKRGGPKNAALRDAEARVRALTREVGSLREDLRRETKRREWAVARSKEKEESTERCEERAKELSYVNKKLSQELAAAQEASRTSSAKNRQAIQTLKQGLEEVERAVGQRGAEGRQRLNVIFTGLQTLEGLLLSASIPGDGPSLPSSLVPEVRGILSDAMRGVAAVGNLLNGGTEAAPYSRPSSPRTDRDAECDELQAHCLEVEKENTRLKGDIGQLKMEAAALKQAQECSVSMSDMQQSLGQYRTAVTKLQAQVESMKERLEEGCKEKDVLRDEVSALQRAIRDREAAHADAMALAQQRESGAVAAHRKLEQEVHELRECNRGKEKHLMDLRSEATELRTHLTEKEENVVQQRAMIKDLQATISNQRNDIRSALDLVVSRKTHSPMGACPQRPPSASNCIPSTSGRLAHPAIPEYREEVKEGRPESPVHLHTHYHTHCPQSRAGLDDSLLRGSRDLCRSGGGGVCTTSELKRSVDIDRGLDESFRRSRNWGCNPGERGLDSSVRSRGVSPRQIKKDMDSIDAEIAELDAALKAAAVRFS